MSPKLVLALACSLAAAAADARSKPPLTPSQIKARYLSIDFRTPESERVHFSLDRLQYQNPHYKMLDRGPLKDLMLNLVTADLGKPAEKALLDKVAAPYKLKKWDPVFQYVFTGEGSPDEVLAVLKLAAHYNTRLKQFWSTTESLSGSVKKFYFDNIGLNCNGFAGSYAHAIGAPQSPRTGISAYASPAHKLKKVADIQPGDVMVWKSGVHITVIQKVRGNGVFDVVESAGEQEHQGLANSVWEIKQGSGDVFKATPVTPGQPKRKAMGARDVYVASLK